MSDISASLVKELREKTGLGMMDCKKALEKSEGNIEEAIINLRKSSVLKAEQKSSRSAYEGVILGEVNGDHTGVIMIEVNCETDFVSKDLNFLEFCKKVLLSSKEALHQENILDKVSGNMEEARKNLVQKIGENIVIRKIESIKGRFVNYYIHNNGKVGSAVSLSSGDQETAKDLAMHVTASKPLVIEPRDIEEDLIKQERDIIESQVQKENKSSEIEEKMIMGRLDKYLSEISLIKQPYVKDPSKSIEKYLLESNAKVDNFIRLEIGEDIEIEKKDFTAEVFSQIDCT